MAHCGMRYLVVSLALVAACLPAVPAEQLPLGANCSRKTGVAEHVPEYLRGASHGDRFAADHKLDLRVVLQMRDLGGLNAYMAAMTTAGSPTFGKPMSPEEFAQRHLPTDEQAASAVAALRRHGLEVDDRPVGALLHARGTARQVEAAFATSIVDNADGGGYMPSGEPQMPDEAIRAVQGLAEHHQARQWATESTGGPELPLTPARIRQAYSVPDELKGAGQTLAIVGLDGYDPADLAGYAHKHGIRQVPVKSILLGGFDGQPKSEGGKIETTMDLELLGAVAPEADAIYAVLAPQDGPHGLIDALNWLANPPPGVPHIKHISCSWGVAESGTSQASAAITHSVLKQLSAQGSVVWAASGDMGAFDDGSNIKVTDLPAGDPWAAAVGGTTLRLGPPRLETTWSGSGGGYSCFWPAPAWQGRAWGQFDHEVMRALPDIALAADPLTPYAIWVNGRESAGAGTSAAAPVAAAIGALLAEARQKAGKSELGFLPPLLYQLGAADSSCFNDVVVGENSGDRGESGAGAAAGYTATPGYDCATGWGGPRVDSIVGSLLAY